MELERTLDTHEVAMSIREPACSVQYEGTLDQAALEEAFRSLCDRALVLRSCIQDDGHAHKLCIPHEHYPDFVQVAGSYDNLLRIIRYPNRIRHGVCRLIVVEAGNTGHVALQANHAVMDARSILGIFLELWRAYTNLVEFGYPPLGPLWGLPRAPSALLDKNPSVARRLLGDGLNPFIEETTNLLAHSEFGDPPYQRRLIMTAERTSFLIAAARNMKVSVHSLVCGSILDSSRAIIPSSGTTLMTCCSVVDLRSLFDPPISPMEVGDFSLPHCVDVDIAMGESPIDLAKKIKANLDEFKSGRSALNVSPNVDVNEDRFPHLSRISVSNVGVVPHFPSPNGLMFVDFQFVSHIVDQLPIMRPTAGYGVYTFDGKLIVDAVFPRHVFSPVDVDSVTTRCDHNLERIYGNVAIDLE